ncbi:gamma-glutamyltransferase family protein [Hyphomicrobium facile]|uniref:Gamma-glutamyltranspeptidase / glutathione hydrolase n=1 Tax=Hyphomicrobium facile TaxID=51670 RepID=A0A1I7NU83_9HYPH|nr:gamma-glutamyltransferase [Hyphomicrobium facile]SFV38158.1 gamma-glutamyltranspeptidase / glutathione hydrolase [Hyphomicrobium facile]
MSDKFYASGIQGCVTAPHRAAAEAGKAILAEGGTAIEAMVAAAATIAVVYPHMNGLGGDAFWLIKRKGHDPIVVSGCGRAAERASVSYYRDRGYSALPVRGPDAALLVPGAIASWQLALDLVPETQRLPLGHLLRDATDYAMNGCPVSRSLAATLETFSPGLRTIPGFEEVFLPGGRVPGVGECYRQAALGTTLSKLAEEGLESFYRGALAETHGRFLEIAGSPLRLADFQSYKAEYTKPISTVIRAGTLYNSRPPTQGLASLLILAIFDRLSVESADGSSYIHHLVEATKHALTVRNTNLGDPDFMVADTSELLAPDVISAAAASIDAGRASPWPGPSALGGTVWMGAADREGTVVSFIQSLFWEFGSGLTCPETGIVFENRGAGFSLAPGPNQLAPRKRPFHTLNPALAELTDGRTMAYGTMGGDGQPQTQAAVFTRYAMFDFTLERAIAEPRWLLGKTWGNDSLSLKLEGRFPFETEDQLNDLGHTTERVADYSESMGHAGAIVVHPSGLIEGASDPRSDGAAVAF